MTPGPDLAREITRAADIAWNAVPDYLRAAKTRQAWGSAEIQFSDRGSR